MSRVGGKRLVADYAWAWLAELRLHILPALGAVELRKLSPPMVRCWYGGLLRAGHPGASTVAKAYRLLHAILATATADELIVKNACVIAGVGIERAPERKVITVTEVWRWRTPSNPDTALLSSWRHSQDFAGASCPGSPATVSTCSTAPSV